MTNETQTQNDINDTMELNLANVSISGTIKQAGDRRTRLVKHYISTTLQKIKDDKELAGTKVEKFNTLIDSQLKQMGTDGKKATLKSLDSHTVRAMKLAKIINERDLRINYDGISVAKLETLVTKFSDDYINKSYDKNELLYAENIKSLFDLFNTQKQTFKKIITGNLE